MMEKKTRGVHWRGMVIPRNVQRPLLNSKPNPGPGKSPAWSCWPEPWPRGNHEARAAPMLDPQNRKMSFLPCPRTAQPLWSCHLMWEVMVLRLRIASPSLRHEHIDRYIYMCMYKYAYVCVYIYICMYKFGPGVDSGSQPLSANKKRINPSTTHLLITKPHAQSPLHELPSKKKEKYYSF